MDGYTSMFFSAIFTKRNDFVTSRLPLRRTKPSYTESTLKGKTFPRAREVNHLL